ncbi:MULTISPECIES: iron-hydroxamate ABC transporter substrate-binding protein [unclassified Lactococcus]|uniref:iron-hydroxamate ABC transporter substrate-binding protein n=1 Tax=unclassified Lactococcus TaxID=2643510 RepID=UPI0011C825BD|nr:MULTISPECIES: iron-hydroxamate ABC transporter substrate-binding protein [unclassified Lactococcus]MQW23699.1 ABC transporter substrate-binding protein [Lactococcus sp. dk101]TXK37531.1 iron-hydroxamate ABC transporter substrate-binding protein [Lactococcus sp. dk310]TXK48951.1 iron-hydroxamate ABC transporter substrate-binding protein [Lactococcus sp. dk322]
MKKTLTSLVALGALFTLAACGSSSQDTKKSTEPTTKTFHALNGDVKVPTHPKRIAVQNYPDEVASIGGNVVGTDSWAYPNPFLSKEQKKNMVDLGSPKFNIEKLTAQNPDLIITVDKDQVADHQKIAPTVLVNYQELSTMDKSLDYFAELLNMEDGKDKFLKSFKKESKKEVAKLKDAGIDPSKKTISILELQGNKIYAYGSNFGRGGQALTTGLGFKQSEKMTALTNGTGYAEVSAESLAEFDADYIFVDFASTDKAQYEALQKNPVWTKMKAVKEGHVITMDYNKVYFYSGPTATEKELSLYTDAILKEN